jgi:hypothetical protein
MTDKSCGYAGRREEILIGYLYDDLDLGERTKFHAHLTFCARCRDEVTALQGVRTQLARWSPPEPVAVGASPPPADSADRGASPGVPARGWSSLRAIPAWMQVAAAMLFLGVSTGIANLEVRYDPSGVSVRTGWSQTAPAREAAPVDPAPWRAELVALGQQLRAELHASLPVAPVAQQVVAQQAAVPQTPRVASAASDAELVRRVRALIDESEQRQQRELALRVADLMRELDTTRRSDLMKIDRTLGVLQNNTGVEVMKQRELLNYLVRVSQKQ